MTNNEKFNQMLNACKHPRQVYNALMAFAEARAPHCPISMVSGQIDCLSDKKVYHGMEVK